MWAHKGVNYVFHTFFVARYFGETHRLIYAKLNLLMYYKAENWHALFITLTILFGTLFFRYLSLFNEETSRRQKFYLHFLTMKHK